MPKAPQVVTFGCRLNAFESEVIEGMLSEKNHANTVVFNTCAVTKEAERQARQRIRRLKRARPDAFVVVTGCGAQLDPGTFSAMPEVNVVLGNREKMNAAFFQKTEGVFVDEMDTVDILPGTLVPKEGKIRTFLQIQNGCDHACTFCVITLARGPSQSVSLESLVKQAHKALELGVKEIILTGVDLTAYGNDQEGWPTFTDLIEAFLAHLPQLKRLRISSLDPAELGEDFFALIAKEPRILPHFHISLQAGADLILKRMKRRHLRADVIRFCERLRVACPKAVLGADVIVGFPTETQAHFEDTLDLIDLCQISLLHVFPYSPRPGTPAARMPQIDRGITLARGKQLRRQGEKILHSVMDSLIGTQMSVLVERPGFGYTDTFLPVSLPTNVRVGEIATVYIAAQERGKQGLHLVGKVGSVNDVA